MDKENILIKDGTVESHNSIEKVTRRILKEDGNGLRLSLVNLFCILIAFAFFVACLVPPLFFEFEEEISYMAMVVYSLSMIALLLGFVFLILPCVSGFFFFAKYTVDGERPRFIKMFAPFRSWSLYFRSILMPIILVARIFIILLPFIGGISYLPFYFTEGFSFLLVADFSFVLCMMIAATTVGAYISSVLFFAPYLMLSKNMGFFSAISKSFSLSKGRKLEITKLTMKSFLDIILSAFSFMVLFVTYAMPRISTTYFVYCNSILNTDNTTNE